jgi:hypothetical protein
LLVKDAGASETARPADVHSRSVESALRSQLGRALQELRATPAPRDPSVHEARKQIKRARASLRLLRETIGEPAYQRANRRLRDAGRPLARVRDAKALIDASARLRVKVRKAACRTELASLDRVLRDDRRRERNQLLESPSTLRSIRRVLDAIRSDTRRWPAANEQSLARAVERIYRKSRKAFVRTESNRCPETLHESRKQTKYLGKALKTLFPAERRSRIGKRAKRAEAIADALGDSHDLTLLRKKLTARPRSGAARQQLVAHIDDRCKKLQRKAEKKGRRLYRRKPKAFVATLGGRIRA